MGGITTAYAGIKQIVRTAKEVAPDALVVLGGGVLTSMPHDIMRFLPWVDVGVVGEAFVSFPEVLRQVDAGPARLGRGEGARLARRGGEPA